MELHAKILYDNAKQNPGTFEQPAYDALHMAAKILFPGNKRVFTTDRTLTIRDRISITFYFSNNECKAYIDTYILPEKCRDKTTEEITKLNASFRLFSFEEMLTYLQMKAKENEWIKANEG